MSIIDLTQITREQVLDAVKDRKVDPNFRHLIEELLEDSTTDIREQVIAALVSLESESYPDLPGQAARVGKIATVHAVIAQYVEIIGRPDVVSIEASSTLGAYGTSEDLDLGKQLTMEDLGQLIKE